MTQILIVDGKVLAFGPFTSDENNLIGTDLIFPKNLSLNWKVIEADIDEGHVAADYLYDGSTVVLKNTGVQKAPVPDAVSPRQIRQALTRVGLRNAVEEAIAASEQDMRDWYEFATAFERSNCHVLSMSETLNVSSEELDDLWRLAGSL